MNKDGYVYILSNRSMPGLVKIGKSSRGGRHRAKEIYQTGVPTPFNLEFEIYTHDCDSLEMYVHERLESKRVNESREFFEIDISEAIADVVDANIEDYGYRVIWDELGDIESDLYRMFKKSGIDDPKIPISLHMRCLLEHISPDAIKQANKEYFEACEQRKVKLAPVRESNG